MFNKLFGNEEKPDPRPGGSERSGNGNMRSTERNEQVRKILESGPSPSPDWPDRTNRKSMTPPTPPPFEQIYQTAAVKPPKLAYGIHKIAEMGNSPHLAGMSNVFRRKALLMALEAAGTDIGEVLNDVVTRQRALKEYEESYQEKVNQFEAEQLEQNRLQKAELDRITAQYKARMDASLAEVERQAIVGALERCRGKIYGPTGAAAALAVKPTTLYGKMRKLGISRRLLS